MKRMLFIILFLFMGSAAALVSLELFLRANPGFGYQVNSYKPYADEYLSKLMWRKRPALLLGYENIPNFSGMNSYGLVSKQYPLKKNINTYRILVLGDSVGEGLDTDFLEDLLNSNDYLRVKYNFEIWNGSVGGYDVRRYYLYLKYKGLSYHPDSVLIFLCLNDFGIDTSVYYKDEHGVVRCSYYVSSELLKRYPPNLFLMQHSYLYRFLVLRLNRYLMNLQSAKADIDPQGSEGADYLAGIKDICDARHLRLVAVIWPYLKPLNEYNDLEKQQYAEIMRAVKTVHIDYLDLHQHLLPQSMYDLRISKEDQIHSKGEKSHAAMKAVYDYVSNNLINSSQR
ncbi:MAG: hypothetical protein PHS66_02715 [Candidatus Omnitrophica bacterium]|nr:hypothetical protein [Candidatus Omnitrophota bacterium]